MADSQVMTCQPLRIRQSKFKTDFSDLFDDVDDEEDEEDDRPLPPPPRLRSAEESRRIWKSRGESQEGWTKDTLENYKLNMAGDSEDDDPDPSNSSTDIFQGSRECEDDDPDPSVTRTDILLVCVPAITIQYQDASASSYLGDQAGNTNTVDRILVGISGAGSWIVWRSNRESQDVAGYLQGEPVGPFGGKLDGEGTRHKGAAGRGVCGECTRPPSRTL